MKYAFSCLAALLLVLLVWSTTASAQDRPLTQIRPGQLDIRFVESMEPPETMVPPLSANQGFIHIEIDDRFPEYVTPELVREWLLENLLAFRRLEILNRGSIALGNPIRFRYQYNFLPGQQFVSLDTEFRGNEFFEASAHRINFFAQQITVIRLQVREDRVPEIRLLTTTGTLRIQSNTDNFTMEYEDQGFPTIRRIMGTGADFQLSQGTYNLIFSKAGFHDEVKEVVVEPGETVDVEVEFRPIITTYEIRPHTEDTPSLGMLPEVSGRNERRILRFLMFTALTSASVYSGVYLYNDFTNSSTGLSALPPPPDRPPN